MIEFTTWSAIFIYMMVLHVGNDWLGQSESMAKAKTKYCPDLLFHSFSYALILAGFTGVATGVWFGQETWVVFAVLFSSHFIIDSYKIQWWWLRKVRRPSYVAGLQSMMEISSLPIRDVFQAVFLMMVCDQFLHTLVILWASWYLVEVVV